MSRLDVRAAVYVRRRLGYLPTYTDQVGMHRLVAALQADGVHDLDLAHLVAQTALVLIEGAPMHDLVGADEPEPDALDCVLLEAEWRARA